MCTVFVLMMRLPPRSTLTDTLFPYTTLFRSHARRAMPWLAVGCVMLYAIFLWRLAVELPGQTHPTASWPVAALEAILSVWLTVLCLLAGQRLLHRPSATLQYLAQSAYWTSEEGRVGQRWVSPGRHRWSPDNYK